MPVRGCTLPLHKASARVEEAVDVNNKVSCMVLQVAIHKKKTNIIIVRKTHTFSFVVAIPVPAYETSACVSVLLCEARDYMKGYTA